MLITLRLHLLRALNPRFQQLHRYCSTRFNFLLRSLNPRFLQLQRSPDRYSSTRFSNHFLRAFDPSSAGLASLSSRRSRPQRSRLLNINFYVLATRTIPIPQNFHSLCNRSPYSYRSHSLTRGSNTSREMISLAPHTLTFRERNYLGLGPLI